MADQEATQLKGRKGGTDERGYSNVTYRYLLRGYSDSDALQFVPEPPPVDLPPWKVTFDEAETGNNELVVLVNYRGIAGTGDPNPDKTQYYMTGQWREEPIETFPDQATLKSKYGAEDDGTGHIKFPPTLPAQQSSFGADPGNFASGAGASGSNDNANPLYGVDTYPVRMQVANKAYVSRSIPDTLAKPGDILDELPDDFPPEFSGNGPWLVDNPEIRSGGNAFEIVEKFKQIKKLDHIEALYLLLSALDGGSTS